MPRQVAPGELWDSGLMRPDGTPRPSFHELAKRLRPGVPAPAVSSSAPLPHPATERGGSVVVGTARNGQPAPLLFLDPAGELLLRLVRGPAISRRGVVRMRASCPVGRATACSVRLAVRARAKRTRNGGQRRGRLLRRTTRSIAPGQAKTVAIRLRPADRRRIKRGRLRVVVAHVAVPGGPSWKAALRTRR